MVPGLTDGHGGHWRRRFGWSLAFALIVLVHGLILAPLVSAKVEATPAPAAPPAIMVELAPVPEAPQVAEQPEPEPTPPPVEEPEPAPEPEPEPPAIEPPPPPPEVEPEMVIPPKPVHKPVPKPVVEEKKPPEVKKPRPPKPKVEPKPAPKEPVKAPPVTTATKPPEVNKAETTKAAMADPGAMERRQQAARNWQSALLAALNRHKRYPRAARVRHQEGVAYVYFRMDGQGKVLSASLRTSSGFELLDDAAVELLHKASPLPAPPPEMDHELVVPISYRLR